MGRSAILLRELRLADGHALRTEACPSRQYGPQPGSCQAGPALVGVVAVGGGADARRARIDVAIPVDAAAIHGPGMSVGEGDGRRAGMAIARHHPAAVPVAARMAVERIVAIVVARLIQVIVRAVMG